MNKKTTKLLKSIELKKEQLMAHPALVKLNRVEAIGHNNVIFYDAYNELKITYNKIIVPFSTDYDKLHDYVLVEKKNGKINKALKELVELETDAEEKLNAFDNVVANKIQDDLDLKAKENELKEVIEECKKIIDDNNSSLKFLKKEFNEYFKDIDLNLSYFNDYLLRGSIVDAKELYESIKNKVESLKNNLDVLPGYGKAVAVDLPNLINSVIAEFNEMQKEQFQLYDIPANYIISECKEIFNSLLANIRAFNLDGFEDQIKKIEDNMSDLKSALDKEKQSKEDYEREYHKTHDDAEALVRDYNKLIINIDDFNKKYKAADEQEENSLSNTVRSLKNAVYSLNRYDSRSYSIRAEKLNELRKQIENAKTIMSQTKDSYEKKENASVNASNLLNKTLSEIKNLEIEIENIDLDKISDKYLDSLAHLKNVLANGIKLLLEEDKIDVDEINRRINKLTEEFALIKKNAKDDINNAKLVAEMIKFANNFIADDPALSRDVFKAEVYYQDGRYDEAYDFVKRALAGHEVPDFVERIK